jgi:single-strand DNA-binding protein
MPHTVADTAEAPDSATDIAQVASEDGETPRRSRGPGLNRVQLIGRLVGDVELRYTAQGVPVTNVRIAVNEKDQVEYADCVLWRATAEFAATYLRRGRLVYVEGRFHGETWKDRDGQSRYSVRIVADRALALDRPPSGGADASA